MYIEYMYLFYVRNVQSIHTFIHIQLFCALLILIFIILSFYFIIIITVEEDKKNLERDHYANNNVRIS